MKYKVISGFIRRSENNKQYIIGDTVELEIEQATQMMKEGFIQVIEMESKPKKQNK